ncbi:MAG: hypothetical protein EH225_11060 [Calditrichaeota bacterium]|nr:hypothetical protein [Calditrichota bacterium]RQV99694.1 MAG: hypothetical protein EH225_11060 [Calditrichota bacterium]
MFLKIMRGIYKTFFLWKLILLFWLLNLAIAVLALFPYQKIFHDFFANRLAVELLRNQNVYMAYAEFYHYAEPLIHGFLFPLRIGGLLYPLLLVLLSGGILHYYFNYFNRERVKLRIFWSESVCFMWQMFKILLLYPFVLLAGFLISLIFILPLLFLIPSPAVEYHYFYFFITAMIIFGLVVLWCLLLLDITRLLVVKNKSRRILREFLSSFKIVIRRPLVWYAVYILMFALWVVSALIYWHIQDKISESGLFLILLHFVLLQFFILIQIGLRWARFGVLSEYLDEPEENSAELPGME